MKEKNWKSVNDLLSAYKFKRDFAKTKEPKGSLPSAKNSLHDLRFVVQEHWAGHHHFDFRLEMDGILRSWAIPKQIPTTPKQKFLAIQTEDHPLEYIDFEGEIPEGQYGGGHVEIYDKGFYDIIDQTAKKILFDIHGKKLYGRYALVQFTEQKKNWLIIKELEDKQKTYDKKRSIKPLKPKS